MIANIVTISRIILSLTLLISNFDNTIFLIIYTICGITDMLDGYVARKMKTESKLGSKLDSLADIFLGIVIVKTLYPIVASKQVYLVFTIAIGILKLISIFIIVKKYKKIAIIHTYLNKITGFLIFLLVYFISFSNMEIIIYATFFIAMITALEELYINIKLKNLDTNYKGIFIK